MHHGRWQIIFHLPPSYPVHVLIVAAVLGKGCLSTLSQQDLGADVPMHGWLSDNGTRGHFITRRGAAWYNQCLGALAACDPSTGTEEAEIQVRNCT